jgi:hypothetical protein
MKQLSALSLSHPRGALQIDFPVFPVFPAESEVWGRSLTYYGLGPHGEPNRVQLRSARLSHCMIRIDDEKER